MRLLTDCNSCGGPMPLSARCPHCGAGRAPASLRKAVLRLALVVTTCCGSSAYGISPIPGPLLPDSCADHGIGEVCACTGTQVCACTDAGLCAPHTQVEPDGG
jgi:hypothetical protein